MGKDLSYCIAPKGYKILQEEDYANVGEYLEALDTNMMIIPLSGSIVSNKERMHLLLMIKCIRAEK